MTVPLQYFDGLVVSTHLIKPGHIRVISGSDLHYYPGQWVIQVSDGDPVATLIFTYSIRYSQGKDIKEYSFPVKPYFKGFCRSLDQLPYGGKLWRWETLANLANDRGFAKFIPTKFYPVKESLT